jgi:hypothetical protein
MVDETSLLAPLALTAQQKTADMALQAAAVAGKGVEAETEQLLPGAMVHGV